MSSNEWIHERVASLIGYSEDTIVEFVLMLCKYIFTVESLMNIFFIAKKSKNNGEIFRALTSFGFPDSEETQAFSDKLFETFSSHPKLEKVRQL